MYVLCYLIEYYMFDTLLLSRSDTKFSYMNLKSDCDVKI